MTVTFGSLFAGIGGFDLGFERAGMVCKWQVEINPFCQKVLKKHWPKARGRKNVKTFPPDSKKHWKVNVICGGFPCQDISNAGKREGITGARSSLWGEFHRIIRLLRPDFVVVENVGALSIRGLGRVLGDLSQIGYDAEWQTLSACMFGAPHTRERLFVVGHPHESKRNCWREQFEKVCQEEGHLCLWPGEPEPVRVVDGVPNRLDRNQSLGNAVVPQIAEAIGRGIMRCFK